MTPELIRVLGSSGWSIDAVTQGTWYDADARSANAFNLAAPLKGTSVEIGRGSTGAIARIIASGHVNRAHRPNTWLPRPVLQA